MVAAHELHRRRPPRMFVGFLAASAAAGLVAVPMVWTGTLGATLAPSTSINFLLLIGAIAFGIGALINDTCLLGSLARLGDGEMRLLALPLGMAIGILGADHGRFGYDATWPSLISRPSVTGLVTLLAFLVVLVLALVFVSMKSVLRTKPDWSFGVSMTALGITGGLLYVLSPAWTFADLVQRGLPLRMSPAGDPVPYSAMKPRGSPETFVVGAADAWNRPIRIWSFKRLAVVRLAVRTSDTEPLTST